MENKVLLEITEEDLQEFLEENHDIQATAGDSHDMLAEYIRLRMLLTDKMEQFLSERFQRKDRLLSAVEDVVYDLEDHGYQRTIEHFRFSDTSMPIPVEELMEEDGNEDIMEEDESTVIRGFVIPVKQLLENKNYYAIGCFAYVEDEEGNMTNDMAKITPFIVLTDSPFPMYQNRIMKAMMESLQDLDIPSVESAVGMIAAADAGDYSRFKGVNKTFAKHIHKSLRETADKYGAESAKKIGTFASELEEDSLYYIRNADVVDQVLRDTVIYIRKHNNDNPKKGQYGMSENNIKECLKNYNYLHEENWEDKIMNESLPL